MLDIETIENEAKIAILGNVTTATASYTQIGLIKLLIEFGILIAKRADQKAEREKP